MSSNPAADVDRALRVAVSRLLAERGSDGWWRGCLSSSALSTATAVTALSVAKDAADHDLVNAGVRWLERDQNLDGGWGDTSESPSNLPTTLLSSAALALASPRSPAVPGSQGYVGRADPTGAGVAACIGSAYGVDRTFAVPILTCCAIAGQVAWRDVPHLPFELALLPRSWFRAARLQVVSYALPALIAVGLAVETHSPSRFPRGAARRAATAQVLRLLASIQPEHGGFLDATPLTAFTAMSLISARSADEPVARRCLDFLRRSVRSDGSWPIDTDLATWVTTSAVTALDAAGFLDEVDHVAIRRWLVGQQYAAVHPYTDAAPGGWGWSDVLGAVPDGDDTSGALLALATLGEQDVLPAGVRWLRNLQNADGGWPTFCRGWQKLPFDQSSPDLTAHAIRALRRIAGAEASASIERGLAYLRRVQHSDGSWSPLWFGSQCTADGANPVLGTARVLRAFEGSTCETSRRGVTYLLAAQGASGGWGADAGAPETVEETALAVSALAGWAGSSDVRQALLHGAARLTHAVDEGGLDHPAPIGLYFASLWYSERLYPVIWTVEALGRARAVLATQPSPGS